MSDADLRELERRWQETGSLEDEARWLRGRLQAGQLEASRLELAADLGQRGACEALGREVPPALVQSPLGRAGRLWRWLLPSQGRQEVYDWLDALEPLGQEVCSEALDAALDLLEEPSLALGMAVVGLTKAGTAQGTLAAAGEVVDELFTEEKLSPEFVEAQIRERLQRWALS